MGHYASFHDKQGPPPVIAHAGPVYSSEANMVSVLEDYHCAGTDLFAISATARPFFFFFSQV